MGIVRFLLAIAVVLAHAGPIYGFRHLNGIMAVQAFFIISGFYMSMILNEKYNFKKSYSLFLSNRILRLFPTYLFLILLTLFTAFALNLAGYKQGIFTNFQDITLFSKIYVCLTNIFIVGQDTAFLLGFDSHGALQYTHDFYASTPPVFSFLLCSPAWSLSLELMFYIIAPFIIRRKISLIITLMVISFLLRVVIYVKGGYYDPWTYRFFPNEILFFLSGNISYRIYKKLKQYPLKDKLELPVYIALIGVTLLFNYIPIKYYQKQYMFYMLFVFSIPFVFNLFKKSSIDRFIGELSYPIYLSHIFVLYYCIPLINGSWGFAKYNNLLALLITIVFSIFIILFIIKPIDKFRESRITKYTDINNTQGKNNSLSISGS